MRQYVHTEVSEETAAIIFQVRVKDYLVFLDFLAQECLRLLGT